MSPSLPPPLCVASYSYGFLDDRVRRRCRLHKLPGMVDVKSPKCETHMCPKQPCCGHLGAKARFCSEHKQTGMVNLKVRTALWYKTQALLCVRGSLGWGKLAREGLGWRSPGFV